MKRDLFDTFVAVMMLCAAAAVMFGVLMIGADK